MEYECGTHTCMIVLIWLPVLGLWCPHTTLYCNWFPLGEPGSESSRVLVTCTQMVGASCITWSDRVFWLVNAALLLIWTSLHFSLWCCSVSQFPVRGLWVLRTASPGAAAAVCTGNLTSALAAVGHLLNLRTYRCQHHPPMVNCCENTLEWRCITMMNSCVLALCTYTEHALLSNLATSVPLHNLQMYNNYML